MMGVRLLRLGLAAAIAAVTSACGQVYAQERGYLYAYSTGVQTPGHPVVLLYETGTNEPSVTVRVFSLPGDAYVDVVRHQRELDRSYARGIPVARGASGKPASNDWTRKVVLPALPVGTYAVLAQTPDASAVTTLDVTTLGVAQATTYGRDGDALYLPVDLRSYDRYPQNARLSFVSDAGSHDLAVVDGIARDAATVSANAALVARSADGSLVAFAPNAYESESSARAGYVQTDRPVYRPGDTIAIRAIVRDGHIGAYAVPSGPLHVRVQAPDGSDVYNRDEAVSAFGTLAASVRLPEDAQVGDYVATIGDGLTKSIVVAAYKKPEYEIDFVNAPPHIVGGTRVAMPVAAKYFFGRPAAGMNVHYTVYSEPHWYEDWWGPYGEIAQSGALWERAGRKQLAQGDTLTGADGRASIPVATVRAGEDTDLTIAVDARDASGRTVTTTASLLVTAAAFRLDLAADDWFGTAGAKQTLRVRSRAYDGDAPQPNARVSVTIEGRRYENGKEETTSRRSFDVTTGANGDASIEWTPGQAGDYVATATAADADGRATVARTYLWVMDAQEGDAWLAPIERPMLVASKLTVAPGSRAKLVLALPKRNRDAVIMTTTDRIASAQLIRVAGTTKEIEVDVPRDATNLNVAAMLPGENGVEFAYATVKVAPAQRALRVTIVPGKLRYAPGERATFTVRAVDLAGAPQRAELGIGVVDESIYAVQADDSGDPLDALYGGYAYVYGDASWFRPNRGETEKAATTADVYSVAGIANPAPAPPAQFGHAADEAVKVRSSFLDTAYWSPSVVTDAQGRATVSFDWPDNLTTWRATGIGVTQDGDIGKGSGTALVTKDFLVRLETPRFLRAGDRSSVTGIAQGLASHPEVRLQLDAGALSNDPADVALTLDRFQSASASWPVTAPGVGSAVLRLSGSDGALRDAMQLPLPLLAGTAAEHRRDAGSIASRASFAVAVPRGYLAGAVHLSLSPSLVAELVQNQRLLDVYPYYCTEQTMSAGLPAVFIGRVLRQTKLRAPRDVDVDAIVAHAVARLGQLQHADGSWGWWEYDASHPFMTAYAMYGLAEFRRDGYAVPQQTFDRGLESLVTQLASADTDTLAFWGGEQPGSEWNTRAFMLFALADAAPGRVDRALLDRTFAHAAALNPYAIAVLGLAEHQLGNDAAARALLEALDRRSVTDGTFVFWRGDSWHYRWEDDPIETTAYALRLEVAMGADRRRIDSIVNFLRSQRNGDWWYTTKDTAAAIYALSEAIRPDSSEFAPDETIRVLVDGRAVRSLHVTQAILDAADASVVVPASMVRDGAKIAFERSGRGALYWSSDAIRYVPPGARSASDADTALFDRLRAAPPMLRVVRSYRVRHEGPWRVGDEVVVTVTLYASGAVQYVAVEDPFPAGAEHQPDQGRAEDDSWSGIQLFDDRAVFFTDRLEAGESMTFRYTLRATTAGEYAAPAPSIYAMYGPPVSALGSQQTARIVP